MTPSARWRCYPTRCARRPSGRAGRSTSSGSIATIFQAITRSCPEVRTAFAALARQRTLANFLRLNSAFSELPKEALIELASQLEQVEITAGTVVIHEGEPAGSMYVIEDGRVRAYRTGADGAASDVAYLRTGDFFGERSLFLDQPRSASVVAVTDSVLLRLTPDVFRKMLGEHPSLRARLEQRIAQYEYQRLARVPLDFAEEILPADATARGRRRLPNGTWRPKAPTDAVATELEAAAIAAAADRRFPHVFQLDEMDCGAACLAMVCRYFGRTVSHLRTSARSAHLDRRHDAERASRGRRGARARGALDPRLEEPARRAAAPRGRPLAGQPLDRALPRRASDHVRVSDPGDGPAPDPARRVPRALDWLCLA